MKAARSWARDFAAQHPDVRFVFLVGSRARGAERPDSDVDVVAVIDSDGPLSRIGGDGWLEDAAPFAGGLRQLDLCLLANDRYDARDVPETGPAIQLWPETCSDGAHSVLTHG